MRPSGDKTPETYPNGSWDLERVLPIEFNVNSQPGDVKAKEAPCRVQTCDITTALWRSFSEWGEGVPGNGEGVWAETEFLNMTPSGVTTTQGYLLFFKRAGEAKLRTGALLRFLETQAQLALD